MSAAFARELPPALRPRRPAAQESPVRPARSGARSEEPDSPYRVSIVAEIGTGHGGDLGRAFELIDAAADAGADCAKFQLVYADEIVHPNTGTVELPSGPVPLYERFQSLEVEPVFFAQLAERCAERGVLFLCTPFGRRSARELRTLKPAAIKVASPELNYRQLLEELRDYGLPLVLSTGVSRMCDIEQALGVVGTDGTVLLHCVTAYPAPEEEYNLRTIETLASAFGTPAGVSDHSTDPELVPALATTCGAAMIEKHFTLSREGGGLDDAIALEPAAFAQMCATVRRTEEILRIGGAEAPGRVQNELAHAYSAGRVQQVLGDGVKRLAASELRTYGRSNRSIHALTRLEAGHRLGEGDLGVLRTESTLTPGLPPQWLAEIIGAATTRPVEAGEGIRLADLLSRP